jgi:hypothetical protein
MGPEISPLAGVQNSPEDNMEVKRVNRTEATGHFEVLERSGVNTEPNTSEATQHPEAPNRSAANTEASTSGPGPNESKAAPNAKAAPPWVPVLPNSGQPSRFWVEAFSDTRWRQSKT